MRELNANGQLRHIALGRQAPFVPMNHTTLFDIDLSRKQGSIHVPHWFVIVLAGALAAVFGIRRPHRLRFSLRTLLVAVTAVALMLGWVMYISGQ
jgi:hypothetical protein